MPIPSSTSSRGEAIPILGAMTLTATITAIPIIPISSRSMAPSSRRRGDPQGQGVLAARTTSSGTRRSGGTSCRPLVVARSQPAPTSWRRWW